MKALLIKASSGSAYSEYKKMTGGPPQSVFSTAACTPSDIDIDIVDETIGMKVDYRSNASIVVIFMSTPDALKAYEISQKFKKLNKVVVLAGLHTAFNQSEALSYCDSIMIGETEGIWQDLIQDFKQSTLKQVYKRKTPYDLTDLKPYPTRIIPIKRYNHTWSVVVSRGCPYRCSFCLIPKFAETYRLRPIQNIIDEINNCDADWIELHSDNLTANKEYALELFAALKPLNRKFYAETTILIAKDLELLQAAKDAGIKSMLFGIETMSKQALKDQGKSFVQPDKMKEYVKRIQLYDIAVTSDFLFGFDAHDKDIFKDTLDYIKDIGFDEVHLHLIIPFPGSKTYEDLDGEGRILTKDWSKYDGTNVVYQPKMMSKEDLENGTFWIWKETEKLKKKTTSFEYLSFGSNIPWKSISALIVLSLSLYFQIYFIWALLFLLWAIKDIYKQNTYLLEVIHKKDHPILYWLIVTMWIALALGSLSTSIFYRPNSSLNLVHSVSQVNKSKFEKFSLTAFGVKSHISLPNHWSISRTSTRDTSSIVATNPQHNCTLIYTITDMAYPFTLADFVGSMNNYLKQEFPSINLEKPTILTTNTQSSLQNRIIMYPGLYKKSITKNVVKYVTHKSFGLSIIAMYDPSSSKSEKQVFKSLSSIQIN